MDHTGHHRVSDRDRELYLHVLPARDVGFKTRVINPKGQPCRYPATNYGVYGRRRSLSCVEAQTRDFFDEQPPPLPEGPVVCPRDSRIFQCQYALLVNSPCLTVGESNPSRFFTAEVRNKWALMPEVVASATKLPQSDAPETPDEPSISESAEDRTTVLIAGHYGMGDSGEEADLSCLLSGLHDAAAGLRTVVVSHDPVETNDTHRTNTVGWTSLGDLARSCERADAIVMSGRLVTRSFPDARVEEPEHPQGIHVDGFVILAVLSVLLRKPLVVLGADAPNDAVSGRVAIRVAILQSAALLMVFDQDATRRLEVLGIDRQRIRHAASPALFLEQWPQQLAEEILLHERICASNAPLVGVVLNDNDADSGGASEESHKGMARALDAFVAHHDVNVLLIPFRRQTSFHPGDRGVLAGLKSCMQHAERAHLLPDSYTAREKLGVISLCRFLLTNCPEVVPFAIRSSVPVIAYLDGLLAKTGRGMLSQADFIFTPSDADGPPLFETLEACYARKAEVAGHSKARLSSLQERARTSFLSIADVCRQALGFSCGTLESSREVWAECMLAVVNHGWSTSELPTQAPAISTELERIERDPVWHWIRALQRLRKRLAPDGSQRHRLFKAVATRSTAVIGAAVLDKRP